MELKGVKSSEIEAASPSLEETSVDAFHQGAFKVHQPKRSGHRSGLDALLLAAALPQNAHGTVADFGAGAGVAGFAALNLNRELDLLAIEKNPTMVAIANKSLLLAGNESFRMRSKVIEADLTANGAEREKNGLGPESVDHVIMNPPYNTSSLRAPPDPLKAEAYMLGEGGIEAWFRAAASMLKPGGTLSLIYRTENLGEVLACSQGRFGGLTILPIHSRQDEPAKRIIVQGTRGSRAPISIIPGFVVHDANGDFTPKANNIFDGKEHLEFF